MKRVITLVLGLSLVAASCTLFGGSGAKGVFKSQDNGETYASANAVDPKGSIASLEVNSLVMDRSNTDTLYVGSASGIHKTENGGETWKYMIKDIKIADISLDPANSMVLFAGGASDNNGKIIKSEDAGVTWKEVYTEPTQNNPVLSVAVSSANSALVFAGLSNGEIVRSLDGGDSWQSSKDIGNAVLDIEFVSSGTAYVLSKNNGLYSTTDQGLNWNLIPVVLKAVESPNAFGNTIQFRQAASSSVYNDMAIDPRNSSTIYVASEKGIMKTTDAGASWVLMNLPVSNQTLPVTAVTVHPDQSNTLLIAVGSTIFKTTNGGSTWESRKLGSEQRVRFIIIDPDAVNNIYLGMTSAK